MAKPIVKGINHVTLYAPDPDMLAEFYETVLDLQIVAQGQINPDGTRSSVFLNSQLSEGNYQLSIFANPDTLHTAFEIDSLADLKTVYALIVERELPIRWVLNHGISLAFYFHDPADNLIKLYWSTGVEYPQPHGHPIDLTQPEATLHQEIANMQAKFKVPRGD